MLVVKVMLVLVFVNVTIDVGDGPLSICQAKSIEKKKENICFGSLLKRVINYIHI